MKQIFGNFIEQDDAQDYLLLSFLPHSALLQRWFNDGLSADFLADYCATFFYANDGLSITKQNEVKGAIYYIVNELLENAIKFSVQTPPHPIKLGLYLYGQELKFYLSNRIDTFRFKKFQVMIEQLLRENPDDLYIRQLEKNATGGTTSNLGLLTIINDYKATMAWKFEPVLSAPKIITATTMVELTI